LTDPQKRAQYDRFGHAGLGSQQGQGFDPSDLIGGYGSIFDAFFGNTRGRGGRSYAGSDLETTLQIWTDAYVLEFIPEKRTKNFGNE